MRLVKVKKKSATRRWKKSIWLKVLRRSTDREQKTKRKSACHCVMGEEILCCLHFFRRVLYIWLKKKELKLMHIMKFEYIIATDYANSFSLLKLWTRIIYLTNDFTCIVYLYYERRGVPHSSSYAFYLDLLNCTLLRSLPVHLRPIHSKRAFNLYVYLCISICRCLVCPLLVVARS